MEQLRCLRRRVLQRPWAGGAAVGFLRGLDAAVALLVRRQVTWEAVKLVKKDGDQHLV